MNFAEQILHFRGRVSPAEGLILVGILELLGEGETEMADLTALQAAVATLETDEQAAVATMQAAGDALNALVAELQAAAGNQAAVDAVTAQITDVATSLTTGSTTLASTTAADAPTKTATLAVDTTTALPAASVNSPYTAQVVVTGGTPPLTFVETPLLNPSGLSMDSATGAISGTPTAAGTLAFTVTVTDSKGASATGDLSITIA